MYSGDTPLTGITTAATTNTPATSVSMGYDSNNYLSSETDAQGNIIHYTRNSRGLPTQIVEGYGTSSVRTTNITWHTTLPFPTEIAKPGLTTDYTYDTQGRLTAKTETDTTTITSPYSTNGRTRTWAYTWSSTGQLLTVDGPLSGTGDTVTYTYNTDGYLQTATDEVGHVTTVSSWDWRGAPLTVADANSVNTTFTYDIHGRVLTATVNPGAAQSEYQFAYDVVGHLTQMTLPGGGYLQYTYDTAGRVTLVTNDRGQTITVGTDLNRDVTSLVYKDSSATIQAQQTRAYDELGRVIQSIGAGSQTTQFAYDKVDNLTSLTDARSKVYQTAFDPLNRAITLTDPQSHTIQYAYDGRDDLTSHTDGNSLQTTRVVDGFSRTIQETSPDRGVLTYWYDAAGNLTKMIDGDSVETDFTYDNASRLLTKTFPAATTENITYTYDSTAGGNLGVGRATQVTDESGSSSFVYDAQGRIISDTRVTLGTSFPVSYLYDANGKVTQMTLPSGRIVTYTRASDGLVTSVSTKANSGATAQTLASSVAYQPFGPLASLTYGNSATLTQTYDGNYWLSRTQVVGSSTLLDLSFARNADGQVTTVTDNASTGRGATYTYSDAARLLTATGPWGQWNYSYDAAGNFTEQDKIVGGTTTYGADTRQTGANRLTKVSDNLGTATRNLTYRTGGDLSEDQRVGSDTYDYSYNARKRLVLAKKNSSNSGQYSYDAFDRQVWREVDGATTVDTLYVYDQKGHVVAEHDGSSGSVVKEYVWLDDQLIAMIDSSSGTANTLYMHSGQIGEPLEMTDSAQTKVWDAYVDPYGTAQTFTTASATLDLRLPGQWQRAETGGLSQNWHRDYDPSLGRYAETDLLGIGAGQNPYAYVNGDPDSSIDPEGLSSLVYNSGTGQLTVYNGEGDAVGNFQAANNAQSGSRGPWAPGTYDYAYHTAHPGDSPDSPYGSNGNFVFKVPGCIGCGVHSGRVNTPDLRGRIGVQHATNGCIRTIDAATALIANLIGMGDKLTTLTVVGKSK